jgi:hypothetical protein
MRKYFLPLLWIVLFQPALSQSMLKKAPAFEQYPVAVYEGKLSMPHLVTHEELHFQTELRHAITKGYDVVEGGTENERIGPNFAGHYVLVQWGCGTDCMEAAIINVVDGHIFGPPHIPEDQDSTGFHVPTGQADMRTLQFRTKSRLLGIPYVGNGMTYWYALEKGWRFIGKSATPAG